MPNFNFARAHNSYLEPPDDDPICEDGCGDTLERDIDGSWSCPNRWCPTKFQGVEKEMAEALVEYMDASYTNADRLRYRKLELDDLKLKYHALEEEVQHLKWVIEQNNK